MGSVDYEDAEGECCSLPHGQRKEVPWGRWSRYLLRENKSEGWERGVHTVTQHELADACDVHGDRAEEVVVPRYADEGCGGHGTPPLEEDEHG